MTKLLCGTGGFCQSIEMVFKYGYKSSKFFSKKLFVWDYIGDYIITFCLVCLLKWLFRNNRSSLSKSNIYDSKNRYAKLRGCEGD